MRLPAPERTTRAAQRDEVPDHAHRQPGRTPWSRAAAAPHRHAGHLRRTLTAEVVAGVVARQAEIGLNGEFGKSSWAAYSTWPGGYRLRGAAQGPAQAARLAGPGPGAVPGVLHRQPRFDRADRRPEVCTGPVKYTGHDLHRPRPGQPGGQAGPRGTSHQPACTDDGAYERRGVRVRDRGGDAAGVPGHLRGAAGGRRGAGEGEHVRPPQPAGRGRLSGGRGRGWRR